MWQMRLFGKADQYESTSSDDYLNDTRDQWTPLFYVAGNEVYDDVDYITVRCKTRFKPNDNVLIAYNEEIILFGYITQASTLIADAQYEYKVSEYLNMLTKYPVPRYGTTTYSQITNKNTSLRSRLDNFSYPGGKKNIKQIMDVVMTGAGSKWSHKVNDYYYNNSMANIDKDIKGPYYRWKDASPDSSDYFKYRWYDIPKFILVPGSYGQLPTAPNLSLTVGSLDLVKEVPDGDPDDLWNQVYYIPWTPDEEDEHPEVSLMEFKKSLVNYLPTLELCATTVYAAIKRLIIDLCKMNVWCEPSYNDGPFVFDPSDTESISHVTFSINYGYVRDHKVATPVQQIQFRTNDTSDDTDIECVLVFGYDHSKDVGMAVEPGSTVPFKTAMWEYKNGRNENELDALARQILLDYKINKEIIEIDLPPGTALYDGTTRIHVGDVIRLQHSSFEEYHKDNGWYTGSTSRYARRMETLVTWGYISSDKTENLFVVKAIRYSMEKTTIELSESRVNIFDILGDKLKRIEGTTQEYDIDYWTLKKADISLSGRPSTEYGYTNTSPTELDYGNLFLTNLLPSSPTGIPTAFLTWDGVKWTNATEYTSANFPAFTSLWLRISQEADMPDIPDNRGIVPLPYIGPWFNVEVKVLGSKPTLNQSLSSSNLDYNNPSCGNAWVIPYQYDHKDALSVWSNEGALKQLANNGKYEFPGTKCRLPDLWRKNIYFESETDCTIAPELLLSKTSGSAGVGCLNCLKIGPIPKGFDLVTISASISFLDTIMAEYSRDEASTLDGTIASRGVTGKSCFTFNFQWCLDNCARPRSTTYNPTTKAHRQGYWYNGTTLIDDIWDDDPDSKYGGKWTTAKLTPTWASSYAIQTATLHTNLSLSSKRIENIVTDASLYIRYVIIFNSYRQYATQMYNFAAMTGWTVSAVCTPGYELLDEWYKARIHKIQMLIQGTASWDTGDGSSTSPASVIIDWPDDEFINDEGYFCYDVRKFLGLGDNYIRLRSIYEITTGVYATAELQVRGSYISGWLKE